MIKKSQIKAYLKNKRVKVRVYKTTASTFDILDNDKSFRNFDTVLAREQKSGKGRMGRSFYSPLDKGIYMTIALSLKDCKQKNPLYYTPIAAVVVKNAIESVLSLTPKIKWVNDLYLFDKKICGILTKSRTNGNGNLTKILVGIGINVFFDEGLPSTATAIFDKATGNSIDKKTVLNRLVAKIIDGFVEYDFSNTEKLLKEYRESCFLIGKRVCIVGDEESVFLVKGIDESCGLIVERDGVLFTLISGEVSVKEV